MADQVGTLDTLRFAAVAQQVKLIEVKPKITHVSVAPKLGAERAAGVAGRGGTPSRADGAAGSLPPPHSLSAASRFALSSRRTRRIALTSASAARLREA